MCAGRGWRGSSIPDRTRAIGSWVRALGSRCVWEESRVGKPGAPLTLVALTALAFVVAGCGDDDRGEAGGTSATAEDDSTTTVEAASDTTAPPTPEDEAIRAYGAAYDAFFEALNPPNPQSRELAEAFSGEARTAMIEAVFDAQRQGVYVVGSVETHPRIESSTASEVILVDCAVETNTTYDATTRAVKDQGSYPTNRRTTVVNVEGGTWTVDSFVLLEEPCTPG
jgi:hypothetical protein